MEPPVPPVMLDASIKLTIGTFVEEAQTLAAETVLPAIAKILVFPANISLGVVPKKVRKKLKIKAIILLLSFDDKKSVL